MLLLLTGGCGQSGSGGGGDKKGYGMFSGKKNMLTGRLS